MLYVCKRNDVLSPIFAILSKRLLLSKLRVYFQILCGTYLALCAVVCMNIYIALLSDTFAREYEQAQANAMMEKAKSILLCEKKLDKIGRSGCG